MKILINNSDRTAEMETRIRNGSHAHAGRRGPDEIAQDISALRLADAASETEYQQTLLRLIRYRDNVDTLPFDIPHRGGIRGRVMVAVKQALWKLLRYQHDRMTFRQNLINTLYTSAIEYEQDRREQEIKRLEARIAELEKRKPS